MPNKQSSQTSVKQAQESGIEFEPPLGFQLKSMTVQTGPDGKLERQWPRYSPDTSNIESIVKGIKEELSKSIKPASLIAAPPYTNSSLLNLFPLADTHIGSRSWLPETGANYDLVIAEKLILEYAAMLVAAVPPADTAIILNLGDYFDVDNRKNATPDSGHIMDVDSRYQKIYRVGLRIKRRLVEMALQKHKRVILAFVEGNHDPIGIATLHAAFEMFFEKNPRVIVDPDVSPFFKHEFGRNLIAGAHGDRLKPAAMAHYMADEWAEMWGRTKFRYAFFGHTHKHESKQTGGVYVESLETISAPSSWAAARFSGRRSMKAFTFHKSRGKIGENIMSLVEEA